MPQAVLQPGPQNLFIPLRAHWGVECGTVQEDRGWALGTLRGWVPTFCTCPSLSIPDLLQLPPCPKTPGGMA